MDDQRDLTRWLRGALAAGSCSACFDGDFPRYIWGRREGVMFEARLTNRDLGHYKGYPLGPGDEVEGLP